MDNEDSSCLFVKFVLYTGIASLGRDAILLICLWDEPKDTPSAGDLQVAVFIC